MCKIGFVFFFFFPYVSIVGTQNYCLSAVLMSSENKIFLENITELSKGNARGILLFIVKM